MPTKRLPEKLVKRLKRVAPRLERLFFKLRNADHRMRPRSNYRQGMPVNPRDDNGILMHGHRIRELNVKRNSPRQRVILKAAHPREVYRVSNELKDGRMVLKSHLEPMTAAQTIDEVNWMVEKYYRRFHRHDCILVKPNAYALNDQLIGMNRVNCPPVMEVVSFPKWLGFLTPNGKRMLARLEKKGFTVNQIRETAEEVSESTGFSLTNLMIIGTKKGKLVFMPLVDVE